MRNGLPAGMVPSFLFGTLGEMTGLSVRFLAVSFVRPMMNPLALRGDRLPASVRRMTTFEDTDTQIRPLQDLNLDLDLGLDLDLDFDLNLSLDQPLDVFRALII